MALRSSLGQAGRALRLSPPLNGQQQRFAGQLPVKPNKHIEEWGSYRWASSTAATAAWQHCCTLARCGRPPACHLCLASALSHRVATEPAV